MRRFKFLAWFILKDRDLFRLMDKSYSDGFINGCAAHVPKTLAGCPVYLSVGQEAVASVASASEKVS